jgi:glycerol-3-phosphate acyltransferase PlsY
VVTVVTINLQQPMPTLLLVAGVSYLLGSIPFGYLLVRIFRGEDVRLAGSGNIGATNVSRKSPALGVMTLLLDALKGAAAVWFAIFVCSRMSAPKGFSFSVMCLAALFAVVGHIFPVWLKFRGGKGVATGLGSFAMIAPKSVLAAVGVFLALILLFRYVSLGSIVAVAVFPLLVWLLREYGSAPLAPALISLVSLLIIAKHHENIRRLFAGTERRIGSRRG